MNLGRYSKFIAAAIGAAVVGLNTFTTITPGDVSEVVNFGIAILTAAGVFGVPNRG